MLPYATPAIVAHLDIWEERERDTLRSAASSFSVSTISRIS